MHKLTGTRAAKTDLWKLKVQPRKPLPAPVEEVLAKFATPFRGKVPISWQRDGNLIRRGKPNKPKIGSSAGKIGKTKVRGAKKVLSDLKMMIKALQDLQKYDKDYRKKHGLDKFVKSIKTEANIN